MTTEQLIAVLSTLIGAPILIELAKQWFATKNLSLQSKEKQGQVRDDREWEALNTALERERQVYNDILSFERQQYALRLAEIEARLGKIQEAYVTSQREYWEERLQRERLQARVDVLEKDLKEK